jgi:Na+/H+ antiporter NhaD/arsenite permease-like protein
MTIAIVVVFVIGYLAIVFEHQIDIGKAASAYCAGTGGSCLNIGSAAGVAAMGLERIDFMWYARRIAPLALVGYLAGVAIYFLQQMILG